MERIVIFTMARGEHGYLREWVEHHLHLGFDAITICEHCTATHYEELSDYVDSGRVVLEKNDTEFERGKNVQVEVFNEFVARHSGSPNWCAFIDTDEYIMLEGESTIGDLIDSFPEGQTSVCLSWRNYGASGHIARPALGIVEGFTEAIAPELLVNEYAQLNGMVKSIVRLDCLERFEGQIHLPMLKEGTLRMVDGAEAGFISTPVHHTAWINHYITKSFHEFFYKNQVRWSESYKPLEEVASNRKLEQFFYFSGAEIVAQVKAAYPFLFATDSPTSVYTDSVETDIRYIDVLVNTFGGVEIYTDKTDLSFLKTIHPSRYRVLPKCRFVSDAFTFRGTTNDVVACKCDIKQFDQLINI